MNRNQAETTDFEARATKNEEAKRFCKLFSRNDFQRRETTGGKSFQKKEKIAEKNRVSA